MKPINFNFKKIKNNLFRIINYLFPLTLAIIIITSALFANFVYKNVYQTIAQAEVLTELKKEVPEEILDKEKFYQILENIKQKTEIAATTTPEIKNPFLPLSE